MFQNLIARRKARNIIKKRAMDKLNFCLKWATGEERVNPDVFPASLNNVIKTLALAHVSPKEYFDIYQKVRKIIDSDDKHLLPEGISDFEKTILKLAAR